MENEKTEKKQKETEIVSRALQKTFDNLDDKTTRLATRETLLAPRDRVVNINGQNLSASELRFHVAQTIENMGKGDTSEIGHAQDLQMMIAHSIENINCETSSSQEYFRWLDDTSDIIKNMNDGYVSEADLQERNDFLNMSHQREAELLVCLSLYANSNNPMAAEQARVIRYKLTKLREMRSAIETTTRDKADQDIPEEEYRRAIPYYKLYKGLARYPFGYEIPDEQKNNLGINHSQDEDINNDQYLFENILNTLLDDMKDEDRLNQMLPRSRLRESLGNRAMLSSSTAASQTPGQMTSDRFNELTGRKSTFNSDKLEELTGRKQTFSIKYASLEAQRGLRRA